MHAQGTAAPHKLSFCKPRHPNNPLILLPAGDQFTGTLWDSLYLQEGNFSVAGLLNMIGFDAMASVAGWGWAGGG